MRIQQSNVLKVSSKVYSLMILTTMLILKGESVASALYANRPTSETP